MVRGGLPLLSVKAYQLSAVPSPLPRPGYPCPTWGNILIYASHARPRRGPPHQYHHNLGNTQNYQVRRGIDSRDKSSNFNVVLGFIQSQTGNLDLHPARTLNLYRLSKFPSTTICVVFPTPPFLQHQLRSGTPTLWHNRSLLCKDAVHSVRRGAQPYSC